MLVKIAAEIQQQSSLSFQYEASILISESSGFEETLRSLRPKNMDASSRPTCLPDTRTHILDRLMRWPFSDSSSRIFWLYGVAGCGKSTVANTTAERFNELVQLGAFIAFSRDKEV